MVRKTYTSEQIINKLREIGLFTLATMFEVLAVMIV